MTKKHIIEIKGCDASTEVEIELDQVGFFVVLKLAVLSHITSRYSCMPTINIKGYNIDRQGIVTVDNGE